MTSSANDKPTADSSTTNIRVKAYVPCVPVAISSTLVATQPLAKMLTKSASSLTHLSLVDFKSIQLKKSELRMKVSECATVDETLIEVCLLNVGDLFSNLTSCQVARGQAESTDLDMESLRALQLELQQVHAFAQAMGLASTDYSLDGVIHPEMLFDTCMKRVRFLQKRWQVNYFQSIELALELQTDTIYGAAASCLTEICQYGLNNQIALEPIPQAQEDVLVSLAAFVDLPFSGAWPVLRERVSVSANAASTGNEGGAK